MTGCFFSPERYRVLFWSVKAISMSLADVGAPSTIKENESQ
jgi:hypothetical protein